MKIRLKTLREALLEAGLICEEHHTGKTPPSNPQAGDTWSDDNGGTYRWVKGKKQWVHVETGEVYDGSIDKSDEEDDKENIGNDDEENEDDAVVVNKDVLRSVEKDEKQTELTNSMAHQDIEKQEKPLKKSKEHELPPKKYKEITDKVYDDVFNNDSNGEANIDIIRTSLNDLKVKSGNKISSKQIEDAINDIRNKDIKFYHTIDSPDKNNQYASIRLIEIEKGKHCISAIINKTTKSIVAVDNHYYKGLFKDYKDDDIYTKFYKNWKM